MRLAASFAAVMLATTVHAQTPQVQAPAEGPKPKFDANAVMKILDKRAARGPAAAANTSNAPPKLEGPNSAPDLYRARLRQCWLPPIGQDIDVTMRVRFKIDGTLNGQPVLLNRQDNPAYAGAVAAATRALMRCPPTGLPADQYERWKMMEITFSPQTALR